MVSIERRRAGNGGRHLPNTYTLHEAPQSAPRAATRTGRGANWDWQGGDLGLPGRRTRTDRAATWDCQGGQIRTRRAALPPPSVLVCRPLTRARESVP